MASENVIHLTEGGFDRVIAESSKPVLVDFWAEWCGPCRALGPTIDRLADTVGDPGDGDAVIAKVDVDAEGSLGQKFGVSSIPTVLVFSGGEVVERLVGLRTEADYKAAIEKAAATA